MKLNRDLEVQEEGEARARWEGKFLEFWASHDRRRDFREVWDVIGAQQRPGVGCTLGSSLGPGESWRPGLGWGDWHLRGSEYMEARSRESRSHYA